MNPGMLIGFALIGGALYFLLKPQAAAGLSAALSPLQQAFNTQAQNAAVAEQRYLQEQAIAEQKRRQLGGVLIGAAGTAGSLILAGGGTAAASGGAGAGAAGAGGVAGVGGALAATGIAAGAALVAWGVVEKGWFRGGWEGVTGNDLRDRFINQFVEVYYPGAGVAMQYEAMVRALAEVGVVGQAASDLIAQLYAADREDEMKAAILAWQKVFFAAGIKIAVPTQY